MPIVIMGMHRSGTSLTTSILQNNGLFIGGEAELFGPSQANEDGHFEYAKIVSLNQQILQSIAANWHTPPKMPVDFNKVYIEFSEQASNLLSYFTSQPRQWGFKDPRTTILYPFWKRVLSKHKVVFCIRHPDEVVASLIKRDGMGQWRNLWLQYMHRGLRYTQNTNRHLVFHQDYFMHPKKTVTSLLNFCNLPVKHINIVKSKLRHHNIDHNASVIDDEATNLYNKLYFNLHQKLRFS